MFRVGRADETLSRTGITHLVEHLALFGHSLSDYHHNGSTGATITHFHMSGSESDVVDFLAGVCASLTDLPIARLETEKEILRTEEHNRPSGANHSMPLWRYGSVGYGLLSYPEWGLYGVGPDEIREWARRWFTRENAVLWIAGDDIPAGLRLPLPSGERMPVPAASSALPVTPAYYAEGRNKVVLDAVVKRSTAAMVLTTVLERELYRALRQEGGYSYTATTAYDSRGDGYATITALADALPDKQSAVLGGFVDVLAKLRLGYIEAADIAAARTQREEALNHPAAEGARLPAYAMNLLTGQPNPSVEEVREKLRAVTDKEVHAVAVEALSSALLLVPTGHTADWAGFTTAPVCSAAAGTGTSYLAYERPDAWLVVGDEGVSAVGPDGPATVRFDECAAVLQWPDGGRRLIGNDGIAVSVEPTLYAVPPDTGAFVDARVPATSVVRLPARAPNEIPKPPQRKPASGAQQYKGSVLETISFVLLTIVNCVVVPATVVFTLAVIAVGQGDPTPWVIVGVLWLVTTGLVLPWILLLKRLWVRRRLAQDR